MAFNDLVIVRAPPPSRVGKHEGAHEDHFYEGAAMLAYAMHLPRTQGARDVRIHPDGEHGKQFDLASWLLHRQFAKVSSLGSTTYGGVYRNSAGQTIAVDPRSGRGDVLTEIGGCTLWAECKGGIINTRHSGQVSRLYKGLCETVGMLMATASRVRQVAVVPLTESTRRLAERLTPRIPDPENAAALLPATVSASRAIAQLLSERLANTPIFYERSQKMAIVVTVPTSFKLKTTARVAGPKFN